MVRDLYQFGLYSKEELHQYEGRLVMVGQQVEQLHLGAKELQLAIEPLVVQVAELTTRGDTMLDSE